MTRCVWKTFRLAYRPTGLSSGQGGLQTADALTPQAMESELSPENEQEASGIIR